MNMARVWEIWKCEQYEKTTDAEVRQRITELKKDLVAAGAPKVQIVSGWYGEDMGKYIFIVEHADAGAFGNTSAKIFADKNYEAQNNARQKNPKIMWVSGGLWVEEDL